MTLSREQWHEIAEFVGGVGDMIASLPIAQSEKDRETLYKTYGRMQTAAAGLHYVAEYAADECDFEIRGIDTP